jgi:hypothetical protein
MRIGLLAGLAGASLLLGACTVRTTTTDGRSGPDRGGDRSGAYGDDLGDEDAPALPPPGHAPAKPGTGAGDDAAANGVLPEVGYLFMKDTWRREWMCTATLIAPDRAITAAHCLDTDEFVSWEIVAPNAPGHPRVQAISPRVFGGAYADVANPDLGVLTLTTPIDLPQYAELTDVVARVEAGEDVRAAAVVRTAEEAEAPLHVVDGLSVTSTVEYGYVHGFGTPMFSEGGDSGAGLFLMENGAITHELIGVARQPEPARGLDHFTRVDSEMLDWYGAAAPPR